MKCSSLSLSRLSFVICFCSLFCGIELSAMQAVMREAAEETSEQLAGRLAREAAGESLAHGMGSVGRVAEREAGEISSQSLRETMQASERAFSKEMSGRIAALEGRAAEVFESAYSHAFSEGVREVEGALFKEGVAEGERITFKTALEEAVDVGSIDSRLARSSGIKGIAPEAEREVAAVEERVAASELKGLDREIEAGGKRMSIRKAFQEIDDRELELERLEKNPSPKDTATQIAADKERLKKEIKALKENIPQTMQVKRYLGKVRFRHVAWVYLKRAIGTFLAGIIFLLPGLLQQTITAGVRRKELLAILNSSVSFGGMKMHIPGGLIIEEHPKLTPFLYKGGGHYFVAKDSGNWARTYIQSPEFPGVMVDLGVGYPFSTDGRAHGRPLIPLLGKVTSEFVDKPIEVFVAAFEDRLVHGKVAAFEEDPFLGVAAIPPEHGKRYYNRIKNNLASGITNINSPLSWGVFDDLQPMKMYVEPYEDQQNIYKEPKYPNVDFSLPARGIYVYETRKTPLVSGLRAGNTKSILKDYVICLNAIGQIIPLATIKDAADGTFVVNPELNSIVSLVNLKRYASDAKVIKTGRKISFDDYKDKLYNWSLKVKAQVDWMQGLWVKGPLTPLSLSFYSVVGRSRTPVYSTESTLGHDDENKPIKDYFLAVAKNETGRYYPINLLSDTPDYLVSLVTSRVYDPSGKLSQEKEAPRTSRFGYARLDARLWKEIEKGPHKDFSNDPVALGEKYMPRAINPYGLPIPARQEKAAGKEPFFYFIYVYGLDRDLPGVCEKSRSAWGNPYHSLMQQWKTETDPAKKSALQKQLDAYSNRTIGPFQFTQDKLFNVFFKIPSVEFARRGNYFYRSVKDDYQGTTFAPSDLFVMSSSSSALTGDTGLLFDVSARPYAISVNTGVVYDNSARKVKAPDGTTRAFPVGQLLKRVQDNQVRLGGEKFLNADGTPIAGNPVGDAIKDAAARAVAERASDLGPFSFYKFQLTIPDSFVKEMGANFLKQDYFIYKATSRESATYEDYVICTEKGRRGTQYGTKYSGKTDAVISLVTGAKYSRSGIVATYGSGYVYTLISVQAHHNISKTIAASIRKEAADFEALTAPPKEELPAYPTMSEGLRKQLDAQKDIVLHKGVKQDPATGKYYLYDSDAKAYFDFAAPDSAINMLYKTSPPKDVGIGYDDTGQYLMHATGWDLRVRRAASGIHVNADGSQDLAPVSGHIALPLNDTDKNLAPGVAGPMFVPSANAKFPTKNVKTVTHDGSTYYFYYLYEGKNKELIRSYFVREVNSSKGYDRYIDFISGNMFNPDGTVYRGPVKSEIIKSSRDEHINITRDKEGISGLTINQALFIVYFSQEVPGGMRYSLSDDSGNNLDLVVRDNDDKTKQYELSLSRYSFEVPVTLSSDGKSIATVTVAGRKYTYQSGSQPWILKSDKGDKIYVYAIASEFNKDEVKYLVSYTKERPQNLKTVSTLNTKSYSVALWDVYRSEAGVSATSRVLGDGVIVVKGNPDGRPGVVDMIYNDFLYTFKSRTSLNKYILHSKELQDMIDDGETKYGTSAEINVLDSDTGFTVKQMVEGKEISREYALDTDFVNIENLFGLRRDVWKMMPVVDSFGNNKLIKVIEAILPEIDESDLAFDAAGQELKKRAKIAGVWRMPKVLHDMENGRYLYKFSANDKGKAYYNDAFDEHYVDLDNGVLYRQNQTPQGFSLPLARLSELLNTLNVATDCAASGRCTIRFMPGGMLLKDLEAGHVPVAFATTKSNKKAMRIARKKQRRNKRQLTIA